MRTTREFLAEEFYLPNWMLVDSEDYSRNMGEFDFTPREPDVARQGLIDYVTPRGLHICISQASYCLLEAQLREGKLDLDVGTLRRYFLGSRFKITELNERFRREVPLTERLQGVLTLVRYRLGRMPIAKFDFDFGNRAIRGEMIAVIAPFPVQQTNADLLRINPSEQKASEV